MNETLESRVGHGFLPLGKVDWDKIKEITIEEPLDHQIYSNQKIGANSKIGNNCFLISCICGNDIQFGNSLYASRTKFGDEAKFGYRAEFGDRAEFGEYCMVMVYDTNNRIYVPVDAKEYYLNQQKGLQKP